MTLDNNFIFPNRPRTIRKENINIYFVSVKCGCSCFPPPSKLCLILTVGRVILLETDLKISNTYTGTNMVDITQGYLELFCKCHDQSVGVHAHSVLTLSGLMTKLTAANQKPLTKSSVTFSFYL